LKHDDKLDLDARHWYECRVVYSGAEEFCCELVEVSKMPIVKKVKITKIRYENVEKVLFRSEKRRT